MEGWRRIRREFGIGDQESSIAAVVSRLRSPVLLPLVTGIGLLLCFHTIERVMIDPDGAVFGLETDRSFGEMYGYLLTAMIIAGLAAMARRADGGGVLWLAAALFTFVLADDLLQLHERAGVRVGAVTGDVWRLPGSEFGQLVYFLAVGAVVLVGGLATWRRASRSSRVVLAWVGLAVLALGGFAVGVDAMHEVMSEPGGDDLVWVAVEDGGEMVVLALLASYLVARVAEPEVDLRVVPTMREVLEGVPAQR